MNCFRLLLFSAFVVLIYSTSASANTFYVASPGGSDGNPGSQAQPWLTIQHAVDTINPGDTIIVKAGTYAGCRIGKSGTAGAVCKLVAEAPGMVLINSLSPANRHQSLIEIENFDATTRFWVIDGFECSGAQRYGIDLRDTDSITVQNCVVHGSGLTGIFLAFSYHPLIQNNESYLNGEHGIYQSNSGDFPTIRGNNLHENAAAGLHMNGDRNFTPGDGIISSAIVEKNVVWENGHSGGSGINCDGVSDSIIRNNLLYNNHASGISLYAIDGAEGSSRNRVYNNTIVMAADGRWCINIAASTEGQPNPTGNDIKNNILYTPHAFRGSVSTYGTAVPGFASDYNVVVSHFSVDGGGSNMTLAQWQGLGYDAHSLVSTPDLLFTNPSQNDFSTASAGPAVNAGVSLSADVHDDINGTARPQGGAYDIGCYEVAGTRPPAPVADFSGTPLSGSTPLMVQFTDLSTGSPTSWSWDFGDGATSTSKNPSHSYITSGSFTVKLTATNSSGSNMKTRAAYITASTPTNPPVAEFVGSPLSGSAPLQVQFTDQSTGAASWSWTFGDGGTSTQQNPAHTYQTSGTFTVSLTVTNSAGPSTRTRTSYVTVTTSGTPPVAQFTANPLSGTAPLMVQFTDQSTGATSWAWDFGDGETSSETNPSHTYQGGGTFNVTLIVFNSSGQNTKVRVGYINVTAPPSAPVAEFVASSVNGTVPLPVQFTDQSTNAPTAWSWDFGDGAVSNQRNPQHTYNSVGVYTVRLTAFNSGGQTTRTRTSYITVTPLAARDFFCSSFTIELGKLVSGDHTKLHASDNSYLKIKSKRFQQKFSDQLSFVFQTGFATLSSLSVTSESRSSVVPVRVRMFLLNPTSGEWEQLDDRSVEGSDDTTTVFAVSNASRFLSSSGEVRLRILTGEVSDIKWKHLIDFVKINAAP